MSACTEVPVQRMLPKAPKSDHYTTAFPQKDYSAEIENISNSIKKLTMSPITGRFISIRIVSSPNPCYPP